MLRLQPIAPVSLELLAGVTVEFEPIGIKAVRAARSAVRAALGADADDFEGAGDALSAELIRRGIRGWSGVLDEDGAALPVTAETIERFIADPRAFEAADRAYVRPWAVRDMEGNASAGSPDGTGAEATPATDIANSAAMPTAKAAASRSQTRGRAAAPIPSTSPSPKKARRSGR